MRGTLTAIRVFVVACCAAGGALAQQYPNKPVRLIVPYPPGGGNDIMARMIGQKLYESLGQTVVVDNRGGAAGSIGTEVAARAPPDGYTLLLCSSAVLTINPHVYSRLRYDPLKDFAPITLAASAPYLLVVHPQIAATTVKELIAYAKARPGQLNFSSSGNGSSTHLAGALFNRMAGVNTVHVPYKGAALATTDLLAGHTQMRFSSILVALPFVRAGRMRALAVTGAKRFGPLPDIPTVAEAALPGFEVDSWYGILAPAGTPPEIVTRLNSEIVRYLHSAEMKERLTADGSEAVGTSPEEFAAAIRTDFARWAQPVRESGARVD